MKIRLVNASCTVVIFLAIGFLSSPGIAADKLIGIHSARTMSQSMPWIADEVGLFRKYDHRIPTRFYLLCRHGNGGDAQWRR